VRQPLAREQSHQRGYPASPASAIVSQIPMVIQGMVIQGMPAKDLDR
jgi:hypothetical protein